MIRQNPFSLYDFLGYFIPGATLIYLIIIIDNLGQEELWNGVKSALDGETLGSFQNVLFFIIISYSVGHIINFLSSILVERFANWIYDYPSKYLLQIPKKFNFDTITLKRVAIWLSILPVSILDLLFGQLFKFKNLYTNKLDDFLVHCIKQKGDNLLNKHFKTSTEIPNKIGSYDFFRIFQHYTFEHTEKHNSKLVNYVVLYGFLRSLTLLCVITIWYLIYRSIWITSFSDNIIAIVIISLTSYLFFMAFMKFYRRYSLEVLMLIAISEDLISDKQEQAPKDQNS